MGSTLQPRRARETYAMDFKQVLVEKSYYSRASLPPLVRDNGVNDNLLNETTKLSPAH